MSDLGVFKSSDFRRGCGNDGVDISANNSVDMVMDLIYALPRKDFNQVRVELCGVKTAFAESIDKTLKDRGQRYGTFSSHAALSQAFKDVAKTGDSYELLSASQLEALEMIFHKIARILNGDPDYPDSWHDIAGYASLVESELGALC